MGFWNWITRWWDFSEPTVLESEASEVDESPVGSDPSCPTVNPATGLPMAGCSMDVAGNPYGTGDDTLHNFSSDDPFSDTFTDSFDSPWSDPFDDWTHTDDMFSRWDD